MSKPNNESSELVKDARERLNLTQEDLAREIGVTRHTVWRWENGWTMPLRSQLALKQVLRTKRK